MKNTEIKKRFQRLLRSKYAEYLSVFFTGAVIYFTIELLWRGYSHLTMFCAGGMCFAGIYAFEKRIGSFRLLFRCLIYAGLITTVEFVFGLVFNIALGMKIWDYSQTPFNFLGQICPQFYLAWILVSLPAVLLAGVIRRFFEKKREQLA